MATGSLEERVANLEAEVARLKKQLNEDEQRDVTPWWDKILGRFKDDPYYEEAIQLGREYRESLRPRENDEEDPGSGN